MTNIDISKVKLDVNISEILNLVSNKKSFQIDINSKIYVNEEIPSFIACMYRSKEDSISNIVDTSLIIQKVFKSYKPQINKDICTLSPLMCWQEIIDLNKTKMLYFDHQSDGVDLFEDKELEEMGWFAAALDITYRQIVEVIEKEAQGSLVYYDNTIQFSGFALIKDIKEVRLFVEEFIKNTIDTKIKEDELDFNDEDIIEAMDFFKIKETKWKI